MSYKAMEQNIEQNDPEYTAFFKRFELMVKNESKIDDKSRYLGILGALIGAKAIDYFPIILEMSLDNILTPNEVKEVLYEAAYILGIANVFPFLKLTNDIFKAKNINLPLENQSKVAPGEGLQKGIEKQAEAFGPGMEKFHTMGPMAKWVVSFMYGEFYTREVLTVKERELVLSCIFIGHGDAAPQFNQHIKANIHVGNNKKFLIQMILSLVPYLGYPRTFNALKVLNDAIPDE